MILYTSDLHFGHSNVIRFDHRPFADADEMDHVLIELWNDRVQADDTVYIVGDLCYRSVHPPLCEPFCYANFLNNPLSSQTFGR